MLKRFLQISLLCVITVIAWAYSSELTSDPVTFLKVEPTVSPLEPISYEYIPVIEDPVKEAFLKRKVKFGDTFNDILRSNGVEISKVRAISEQINKKFDLGLFKAGEEYNLTYSKDQRELSTLSYRIDSNKKLVIDIEHSNVTIEEPPIFLKEVRLAKKINSSLGKTLMLSSMSDILSDKILTVFAWKIDFKNLKKGDYFKVIYNEEIADGEAIGIGNIKVILFHHDNQSFQGFWFDNGFGGEFFDENGINLSRAPIVSDQISSLFAKRRFHPVRRTYRAHYGMDFMAETGTSVFAAKNGKVLEAGYRKANGNYVKIGHENKLVTMYLHLSEIDSSIHVGDSVITHQQIGRVGSTGLSSGPHLCFRVYNNGIKKDPIAEDFPLRPNIPLSKMENYLNYVQEMKVELDKLIIE